MKNTKYLVSHLLSQSALSALGDFSSFNRIKELLQHILHRFILFVYIRHNIVFFALNNSRAKQELDNIINSIKTALKQIQPHNSKNLTISNVQTFILCKIALIFTKDKEPNDICKDIRKIIKKKC